ncbi:MAG: MBL fold metallo-hydrolase [Desulfurococcales archaeon]|nr:MBL fold metallo-hydrolase [Desulfurococcales archaeon]
MKSSLVLTIINDNEPGQGLMNEWGLSIHAKLPIGMEVIFDFDTEPSVLKFNMEKLGIDPGNIRIGVLSHRHMDHSGGLSYIAMVNNRIELYVTADSLSQVRDYGFELIKVNRDGLRISESLYLTPPLPAYGLLEQALLIYPQEKHPVLLVGCSHPGVDKLAEAATRIIGEKLYLVIGGFHMPSRGTLDNLTRLTRFVSPIHCSGEQAKNYVRKVYSEKYIPARTGSTLEIPFE